MSQFVTGRGKALTAKRLAAIVGACALATAIVAVVAPLLGAGMTRDGFRLELMGPSAFDSASTDHVILWTVRVPRVLATLLVGGALAGAGCALQALLRNPLAEPFTLGISAGGSLAAVLAIRFGLEAALGTFGIGAAALVGSMLALGFVLRIGRVGRHLPPATVILAGVAFAATCSSLSTIVQYTSDYVEISRMMRWMIGDFGTVRLEVIGWAAIPIGIALVVLLVHARALDALAAGPEVAASLGVSVPRTEAIVFTAASVLAGVGIALCGPIGFVGLIVPHTLRAMFGPDHRILFPASVFGGAILLTLCDTLARLVIAPAQWPTGAVTGFLGGPFFLLILIANKRRIAMLR